MAKETKVKSNTYQILYKKKEVYKKKAKDLVKENEMLKEEVEMLKKNHIYPFSSVEEYNEKIDQYNEEVYDRTGLSLESIIDLKKK